MSIDDRNVFYENEPNDRPRPQPTPMGRGRSRRRSNWLGTFVAILLLVILTCGVVYVTFFADVHVQRTGNGLLLYFGTRQAQPAETHTVSQSETPAQAETPEADTSSALAAQPAEDPPSVEIESSPAAPATPASEDEADGALSLQEIYKKCIGSVVSITASAQSGKSSGTGIVLSADGYLITNHHVIENAQVIAVQTSDDRQFQASIIGSDEASDLAVLKVDATDLQPAEFGDSGKLAVGDRVVAIGDPLGAQLRGTMTSGIVSAINRDLEVNDRTMTLIQTDAALNNGNSGGPLINCYGQVIGINTMKLRSYYSTTAEGLGFAIPMAVAKPILEELMENGYVAGRPAIGISYDTLPLAFRIYYNLPEGVYISAVYDGSDAQAKGVAAGDIITAVNGTRVTSIDELNRVKNQFTAGDSITLTLYNGGSYRDVEVTLIDQATGQ
ncbi:MAG: trypsin-like peptidase domain-containing protein [Oscillospiraceae bacterium]